MKVRKVIEKFLAHVRSNHSPGTARSYEGSLSQFKKAFGKRHIEDMRAHEILEFIDTARKGNGGPYSPDAKRLLITSIELLQRFAVRIEAIPEPIIIGIKKPRGRCREKICDPRETIRILRAAPRDFRRIYQCLRLTGARPNELCRATIADLEWDDIRIAGGTERVGFLVLSEHKTKEKTGKDREIAIGPKIRSIVEREIGGRSEGPIFRDASGRPWSVARLSRIFRGLRDALGISKDIKLYSARHEFGTVTTREHGQAVAQKALGHSSPMMTARYTHLDRRDIARAQFRKSAG